MIKMSLPISSPLIPVWGHIWHIRSKASSHIEKYIQNDSLKKKILWNKVKKKSLKEQCYE